jgi:membrane-associated protease RseP (regulator of RpoE activity)
MALLYYTFGVLAFVVAMLASIGLHEVGHMVPARKFGGKVTQYFIGFGPTLWSKQVGETEYGVKAIPLGGYVKIIGMLPPGAEELAEVETDSEGNQVLRVRKSNTGLFTQLISDARAAEWELVQPEDEPRLFYKLSWWKKVVVMAGGPTVNLVIAFLVFWGIFATVGNGNDVQARPVVSTVSACVVPAAQDQRACTAAELRDHPSPAAAAGIEPGDRLVSWNGQSITSWQQVQDLIRGNGSAAATLVIERDGAERTLHVTTQVTPRPVDPAKPEKVEPVGFLGVTPVTQARTGGPLYTLGQMGGMVHETVQAIGIKKVANRGELWDVIGALGDARADYVLERFVPGDVYHVDSIVFDRRVVFAVASHYATPPMAVAHEGGIFVTRTLAAADPIARGLLDLNQRLLNAFGMQRGVSHTEFIRAADGTLNFLETSARVGGAYIVDVVEAATGINLWKEWARVEIAGEHGTYSPPASRDDAAGIALSLARQEWPDMSAYTDEEIVFRVSKRHHAGLIVRSPDPDRVTALLDSYVTRFYKDFHAFAPLPERAGD